jgi:outer membrane protein OmpA-like peptidoglycan-associated protein
LPRGEYTYNVPADMKSALGQGERLPMDRYEALLEVYQAQNAVQIARSMGADQYAPDTFNKAEALFRTAQDFQLRHADRSTVVTAARQAAQTAEDARTITVKRKQDEQLAKVQEQVAREQELRIREQELLRARAEADAQAARNQSSADRMQLDAERASRQRAEAEAAAARAVPPPAPTAVPLHPAAQDSQLRDSQRTELRMRLQRELNSALPTLDTPRGLTVTLPDSDFRGSNLNPGVYHSLAGIAAIVASYPGLYISVDGHADSAVSESRAAQTSYERAAAVREELARAGVPPGTMSAHGLGSTRPVASNATATGREQNRRVEITISGDPIGNVPSWDRTYPLTSRR